MRGQTDSKVVSARIDEGGEIMTRSSTTSDDVGEKINKSVFSDLGMMASKRISTMTQQWPLKA